MASAATSLDFSVSTELAGESRKSSHSVETLNDKSSTGNDTLNTEMALLRGMDTGREEGSWLYFFLSAFFLLLSRNLRCPDLYILCEISTRLSEKGPYKLLIAKQVAPFHTVWTCSSMRPRKKCIYSRSVEGMKHPQNTSLFCHKCDHLHTF